MKNFPSIHDTTDPQNPSPASGRRILGLQLWLLCGAALLAFSSGTRANDGAFSGTGGTPKLMKGEHRSVVMQSEKVVILANDKTYETTVDFTFRNDGGATSVQMGFPEGSFGDDQQAKKTSFLRFATWVDGHKAPVRRIITHDSGGSTEAYWLKTVRFGPKQTRRIRVSYAAPMIGTGYWGRGPALAYDFTGQNWKGKVERSDLEIRIGQPGLWIGSPLWNFDEPLAMNLHIGAKEAVFRKTWRNWQANGRFWFGLTRAVPFWMWDRSLIRKDPIEPKVFAAAKTFRVGAVPTELPTNAEAPPAFARNGATYVSLSHLRERLAGFRDGLGKDSTKTRVEIEYVAPNREYTLRAGTFVLIYTLGSRHMRWASRSASSDVTLPAPPILLRGEYGSRLYVPLQSAAKILGIGAEVDAKNRLITISRGNWPQK